MKLTIETNPDIVLMDIRLNDGMDGIELAEQIYKLYNIPFIYLTGSHDDPIMERSKTN